MKDERVQRLEVDFVFGAADVAKSVQSVIEGEIKQIHLRVPNFTDVVTLTLSVEDEDGYEVFTSGEKAKNANYNLKATDLDDTLLIASTFTLKATLSAVHGGAGDEAVKAVIYYWGIQG
jgi:hypothetical protein